MMRTHTRLFISIISLSALVAVLLASWQAGREGTRLRQELERRSSLLSDSLRESIEPLLARNADRDLTRLVNKFSNRERLLGVAVHGADGKAVVVSSGLEPFFEDPSSLLPENAMELVALDFGYGEFIRLGDNETHAYSVPLSARDGVTHILTLFHNANFIKSRVGKIWLHDFLGLLAQALVVGVVAFFLIYLNVMTPIRRTADWIKKIRLGEVPDRLDFTETKLLGPLAREISQMAKSLVTAREAAEEEARLRLRSESLWTPDRLKEFVRKKLKGRSLFVVSNREPYMHIQKGKDTEWIQPASGLVTAIEPILKACDGTWVAHGAGDADRRVSNDQNKLRVPPDEPQYTLKRVWITKKEEEGYYYGFSNEGLWPLCHIAHTRPVFRAQDWLAYEAVNKKFAAAVLQELKNAHEPCILIQDYHFALLPELIKAKRPDARVCIFWHIPWPNPESFGICPWRKELLQGMLGADIIGFHTQYHCNNFVETVERFLECRIDYENFTVNREGSTTWVQPYPISIAFEDNMIFGAGPGEAFDRDAFLKQIGVDAEWVGVGVDRLDYTKGIVERFHAIEHFLEIYPQYQGKFTFIELAAPSRGLIPKYQDFQNQVEQEAQRINERFKSPNKNWKAIILQKKHHSRKDILPFYRVADICMVTSLHDGMNLVAKEFVTARDDNRGALILSQFTGASRELQDALIINPYDVRQTAEAIRRGILMPEDEQNERMRHMRNFLRDRNVYRWAADLVTELAQIRIKKRGTKRTKSLEGVKSSQ